MRRCLTSLALMLPVLYLRASRTGSASAELSAIPRIRFVEVEGPHFLLQAKPSAAAAHVQAFLREMEVVDGPPRWGGIASLGGGLLAHEGESHVGEEHQKARCEDIAADR